MLAIVAIPIGAVIPLVPASVSRKPDSGAHQRQEQGREFVSFTVEQDIFALDASDVVEAVDAARLCHSAALRPPLVGMLNHDSDERKESTLIPVIDMHALVGHSPCTVFDSREIIVVRRGAHMFGILVSALGGLLDVASHEIEPPLELPGQETYVCNIINSSGQGPIIQVFDPMRLVRLVFDI
jgi:chemotaxis signal transduction protein